MLNKVFLMGRLTADPELKQTPNGISVVSFSLAVERDFASKGQERQADFINIVAWRNTAEFISKYFSKGKMIIIQGAIQTRNYEDKSGNKRTAFEIVADQVYFGESKSSDGKTSSVTSNFKTPEQFSEPSIGTSFSIGDFEEIDTDDSDLPF